MNNELKTHFPRNFVIPKPPEWFNFWYIQVYTYNVYKDSIPDYDIHQAVYYALAGSDFVLLENTISDEMLTVFNNFMSDDNNVDIYNQLIWREGSTYEYFKNTDTTIKSQNVVCFSNAIVTLAISTRNDSICQKTTEIFCSYLIPSQKRINAEQKYINGILEAFKKLNPKCTWSTSLFIQSDGDMDNTLTPSIYNILSYYRAPDDYKPRMKKPRWPLF